MKALIQGMACAAALGLAALHAQTDSSNPYQVIGERNIFGLRTPPPAKSIVPGNSHPEVDIRLIGLMDDQDGRKALFAVFQPNIPNYYFTAKEGEKNDYLEVKSMSYQEKSVGVVLNQPARNQGGAGADIILTLEKNSWDKKLVVTPGMPHRQ